MSDKSPRSKQRKKDQKKVAAAAVAKVAQSKRDSQGRPNKTTGKHEKG